MITGTDLGYKELGYENKTHWFISIISFAAFGDEGFECHCGSHRCHGQVGVSRRAQALRSIDQKKRVDDGKMDDMTEVVEAIQRLQGKDSDGMIQFRQLRKVMTPATVPDFIKRRSPRNMIEIARHVVFATDLGEVVII